MPGLARAASLIVIAGLSLWPGAASALDRAGSRWSDPVPLGGAGTYVGVSAVGASYATRIVVGERRDRTADAGVDERRLADPGIARDDERPPCEVARVRADAA